MTRVALIGPPCVVTATVSKIWNDPIMVTTRTITRTGRSSGNVIRQNVFHSVEPSTSAASYTYDGIVCSPANTSSAVYPICRQTLIPATVGIAQCESPKNATGSIPTQPRNVFTMPTWKSSIQYQTSATTTFATRYGSSTTARTVIDLVSRYISIAMPIARIVCAPMLITTYSSVTTSAFQKKLSC